MVIGTPTVLNLIPGGVMKVIHVNQVNENIEIQFRIMNGAQPFNVPEGVSCTIRGTKGDNFGYAADVAVTAGSNIVTVTLTEQLTAVAGAGNIFELVFVGASDDMKVSTENFLLDVERAALGEDTVISDSDLAYADQVLDQLQSVGAVNAQVQQNKANIAAEITRATAAEQTLQQNINAEAAARQAAENTLQSNINAEASSRATTDASLQSQINQLVAPSGEAPSAAEVQNARIGTDGTVYPTLGDAIRTQNSLLKSQLEEIVDFDSYNLIKGKSITPKWYVNPSTGEGSTNAGFFSVTNVDVSDFVGLFLYIYTSKSDVNVNHTARSVTFYNASGTYISGMSGGSLFATTGYSVPTNAKFMSVTFHYENEQLPSVFYVSKSIIPGNYNAIKQDVEVPVACVPGLTDILERTSNLFDPSYLVTTAKCNRIGNEYIGAAGDFRAFVNGYPVTFDDPDAAYTFSADIKIEGGTTGVVALRIAFGYGDSATNGVNVYPGGTYERYILHTSTKDHGGVTKLILNNTNTAGAKVYIKNAMLVKGQETSYIPYKAAVDATARQQVAELAEEIEQGVSGNATNIRFPCINFQFDDGAANDANIVSIFQQFNLTCGFAIISNMSSSDVTRYLGYQTDGFEMICHADSGTGMADATVSPETIENRLKTSKDILEGYGFHIKGFVTPNSTMADVFKPILRKYYQWAETVYFGSYTGTGQPYMKPVDGVYNGWRVSLQTTTLANQKAAVDACIANYGVLTFYGHSADMDGSDNLTTANLTELLTYIAAKVQNGYCKVGNPSDIIQNYFNVRNDDILSDWISVPYTDASLELDSRLEVLNWDMRYSPKLKLFSFGARLRATEAISGSFIICKMPVRTYFNGIQLINESSGKIMIYDGKITSYLSSWESGTSYRMNVVCACY